MDDLISRQAAIKALEDAGMVNYLATGDFYGIINALNVIKGLPTINPVKRGRWKRPLGAPRCSYRFRCSECLKIAYQVTGNCGRKNKTELSTCTYSYCPNCGARMMDESE